MASERVGGLYVAVGVNAKPALDAAQQINKAFDGVATSISSLDKKTTLNGLSAQLKVLTGEAEKAKAALASIGGTGGGAGSVAAAARAQTEVAATESRRRTQIAREEMNLQQAMQKTGLQQWGQMQAAATREMQNELKRRELAAKRSADAQIRESQRAAREQVKIGSVLTSGAQELFVGLGAARSGNYFYGLAAGARYAKNFSAELTGASASMKMFAGGTAAGVAAVALLGAAFVGAAMKVATFGQQGAADLQTFQIQLQGLLGDADRARSEFDFLLNLGKESVVPTGALIDADRQLLAFGVTADGVRRGLVQFASEWGTATGKTAEQIYYLNLALGQVSAIGKANTVDMRQLANVGVSTSELYAIIGERIGKSSKEVAAGLSEGLITSDLLFAALLQYGQQFKATADAAKQTTNGLLQNIKDNFTIGLSQAFLPVNDQVAGVLQGVLNIVKSIDFNAIGAAFANAMMNIKRAFAGVDMAGMVQNIIKWAAWGIQEIGANIANIIRIVRLVVSAIHEIANSIVVVAQTYIQATVTMATAAINVVDTVTRGGETWLEEARQTLADIHAQSVAESEAARQEVAASAADIVNIWENTKPIMTLGVRISNTTDAKGTYVGSTYSTTDYVSNDPRQEFNLDDYWSKVLAGLNNKKTGGGGRTGGGSSGTNPLVEATKKWIEDAKQKISTMQDALKSLSDAITTPFATAITAGFQQVADKFGGEAKTLQSNLQKAFITAVESGDAAAVVAQYTDLRKNLYAVYGALISTTKDKTLKTQMRAQRDQVVGELQMWTAQLAQLAAANEAIQERIQKADEDYAKAQEVLQQRREQLTAQYEAQRAKIARTYDDYYTATSATEGKFVKGSITLANEALKRASDAYEAAKSRLDELIAARTAFLDGIKSSIASYMNVLSGVSTEIQKYTRLDEYGSFALTKSDQTDLAAFKQGLQDRLDALKKWRSEVQQLMSSGLDAGLLQQIVTAGPEQTAGLVTALAGASQADIAAINSIQQQVATEVTALQTTASQQWFDAGIAAQQAFLAPLESAYQKAQEKVNQLQAERDLAMGILEAWYADQNAAIKADEDAAKASYDSQKKALEAELMANNKKAKDIADQIQNRFKQLPTAAWKSGANAMASLAAGMESQRDNVMNTARSIANAAAETIRNAMRIGSPSKVMMEIGEYIGQGLALGMEASTPTIEASALTLSASVVPQFTIPAPADPKAPTFIVDFRDDRLADLIDIRITDWDAANSVYVGTGRRV